MFIFSKFFSFIFFGQIWSQNLEFFKLTKIWYKVDCYMLISILMFIFSKLLSFIFFGQIWSQNLKFSKLTEIWYSRTLLYAYYDFNVYFYKGFVIHIILGKFGKFQNVMGKFRSILLSPYRQNYIVSLC